MDLGRNEADLLISEISRELGAKRDGGNKNLIATCPYCNKAGKYGVYIAKDKGRKKTFMAHCFSCGASTNTLEQLLEVIQRPDLMVTKTVDLEAPLANTILFPIDTENEIDDSLGIVELPDFYRRTFSNNYLRQRGFVFDDYEFFPVGTTVGLNFRYDDYVIFPVMDEGDVVGYVARHSMSKPEIEQYNRKAKQQGNYLISRFKNSTENEYVKLLYNFDNIIEDETDTVIIVEGIFDVIALTRKLELYDTKEIAVVATFGKKISQTQVYKLQNKGVATVIIGYDGDAVVAIKKTITELSPYFDVFVADIPYPDKDWEDLSAQEIYSIFSIGIKTPIAYNMNKIQM